MAAEANPEWAFVRVITCAGQGPQREPVHGQREPVRRADETDEQFAAHVARFAKAKQTMADIIVKKTQARELEEEERLMDKASGGAGDVRSHIPGPAPKKARQATINLAPATAATALRRRTSPSPAASSRPALRPMCWTTRFRRALKTVRFFPRSVFSESLQFWRNGLQHPFLKPHAPAPQIAMAGSQYAPPSRRDVGGSLLMKELARVKERVLFHRKAAAEVGETLVSDGATNVTNAPILNLLSVCAGSTEFIKAKDCSGKVKDKAFIASFITEHAKSLPGGGHAVVQVLMDNAQLLGSDLEGAAVGDVRSLHAARARPAPGGHLLAAVRAEAREAGQDGGQLCPQAPARRRRLPPLPSGVAG